MFLVMDTEVHEVFQVLMYVGGSCHGGLGAVGVDIELSLDRCSQLLHCGLQVLHLKLQCEILEDELIMNYLFSQLMLVIELTSLEVSAALETFKERSSLVWGKDRDGTWVNNQFLCIC